MSAHRGPLPGPEGGGARGHGEGAHRPGARSLLLRHQDRVAPRSRGGRPRSGLSLPPIEDIARETLPPQDAEPAEDAELAPLWMGGVATRNDQVAQSILAALVVPIPCTV